FDIRILLLSILLAAANMFIYGRNESTLFSVMLGLVLLVVIWIVWLLGNLIIVFSTRFQTEEGEKKQLIEVASRLLADGNRNRNGVLMLTDQRFLFKTYFFAKDKEVLDYALEDIKTVKLIDKGFIERFHMEVQTRSKAVYRFNIYAGKRWEEALLAANLRVKIEKK
ncbi:MAG: PH domain-containing protein, partial [Chloroflexota bacterium]|nr:PH domain-containing protein [Chloroflexota bacterium]